MSLFRILLCFLVPIFGLQAAGWHDYQLDIGDDYLVYRNNSFDIGIGKTSGKIILTPYSFRKVGPLVEFATTSEFILTKNLGKTLRPGQDSYTPGRVNPSQTWYFIIPKSTGVPAGPYSEFEFTRTLNETGVRDYTWKNPRNPNPDRALMGSLIFMISSLAFLRVVGIPILLPIVAILFVGWVVVYFRIRKKQNQPPQTRPEDGPV